MKKILNKIELKKIAYAFIIIFIAIGYINVVNAQGTQPVAPTIPRIDLNITDTDNPQDLSESVQLLAVFTVLSLLPSIIIMMTSFTRIIVILSFLKQAIGAQQSIPSQVLVGLALFLTFFIMYPVIDEGYNEGIKPYVNNEITQEVAFEEVMDPLRRFMFRQTRETDLKLFVDMSSDEGLKVDDLELEDIPNNVLIPSFIISELKTAFQVGFLLYIPFIVIDMVVSSTLMSMGMMMLPPMMISMPFKILLFVLVDGWDLVIKSIVTGFN